MSPPLCRCCGKRLRKLTVPHWVRADEAVMTKAECQKLTNARVISVRRGPGPFSDKSVTVVRMYTTWDGESYESAYGQGYFCKQAHAVHFANLYAKEGKATSAYNAALAQQ